MEKYSLIMRLAHWLLAVLIVGSVVLGVYMTSLPDTDDHKWGCYDLHKSVGMSILGLFFLRVIVRFASTIPTPDKRIAKAYHVVSQVVIFLTYVMTFLLPFSGYTMSMVGGHGVKFFGLDVPNVLPDIMMDRALGPLMHTAHVYGGYLFAVIISLHIIGTVKHICVDRINILKRMV